MAVASHECATIDAWGHKPTDPWEGAQQALEQYTNAMKRTPPEDIERVCMLHGPLLARAVKRLPHNAPMRLVPGEESFDLPASLPQNAAAMVRQLTCTLEPIWRSEQPLIPEPFLVPARQAAALAASDACAAELCGLLEAAPDWRIIQVGQWVVAEILERTAGFLRWFSTFIHTIVTDLQCDFHHVKAFQAHAVFLQQIAQFIRVSSVYMQTVLYTEDPTRAVAIRCWVAAAALGEAAQMLQNQVRKFGVPEEVARHEVIDGTDARRSIIGFLGVNRQMPEEKARQCAVDADMQMRRQDRVFKREQFIHT